VPRDALAVILLRLYSRPGCHLCDDMKAAIARATASHASEIRVEEVDISTDPALEARYGLDIPVLEMNGRRVAKYRVSDDALGRMLRGETSVGE
jgi:Glutaredoxin-like domain (DUF836)